MFAIQITWKRDQTKDHLFGMYIVTYNPTIGEDGCYDLRVTPAIHRARRFPTRVAAIEYFARFSPNANNTADGNPARPLMQQYFMECVET